MTTEIRGYVVRGTWKARTLGGAEHPDRTVYAYWWDLMQDIQWCSEPDKIPFDGRLYFATVGEADAARCKSSHLSDVGIFRVFADGREERLPGLEEALDRLGKLEGALSDAARTPLAALAAAEQRLLVSERWTPGDRGFWTDPDDGTQWPKAGALEFVRRKLAAKGSAR